MRPAGTILLSEAGLEQACLKIMNRSVRDAVFGRLFANPEAPKRELRAVAMKGALILPPSLLEAEPAILQRPEGSGPAAAEMTSSVPFTGEAVLFRYAPPIWPPARKVRGAVTSGRLLLSAQAWGDERQWLPAVLASELDEIQRILAAQQMVIRQWLGSKRSIVRQLIDKVYPRVSPDLLRSVLELAYRTETDAPGMPFARNLIHSWRSKLWLDWTR